MKLVLKNLFTALFLAAGLANVFAQNTQKPQRTIVIMIDGFGEDYYRNSDMPNLNKMEKEGIFKIVPSIMPAVTNVNNVAIATSEMPDKHGITGNVWYNPVTKQEEFIEDPDLIIVPTIFDRAKAAGIKSALFSVKKKTIDIMSINTDISLCPECDGADESEWAQQFGAPPAVYSKEVSYWIMESALYTMKKNPDLGFIYIHTTDYPMHTWAPEDKNSKEFLHKIDEYIGKLHEAAPDAAILITADHGLNHKDLCWDLEKACANRKTPIRISISPEKDRYFKHHRGMGGSAYVYLKSSKDLEKVKKTILSLQGVEAVLTKEEAIAKYHLLSDRVGDLMVLGNKTTVFGLLQDSESEKLPENYRSHGSTYECIVPLFVYNAKKAPDASFFDHNYKVAAWLYR
ncbi:alkaline phosphatase family protein [Flavobacterium sp. NRK1]|uniref:alkaline phosphatase family protein n=1 Tax=Flavobacterium sp. NRK1 TaxID=2954929 RepID=UPI002093938C|nr:nucleotide pyrophosphatase/phosphodiesterase family protein [Flavobacterium sp. NRK1]MCO6147080.1 alkaline phosphatase family protein [Flavobacterium sp. NRK1]